MFTKDKLEKWMENLGDVIVDLQHLKQLENEEYEYIKEIDKEIEITFEIINTLEQLHTSITSDNSI